MVFGLTGPGLEYTIYRTRDEHANHYTTDEPTIYHTRDEHANHYTTDVVKQRKSRKKEIYLCKKSLKIPKGGNQNP